MCRCTGCYDDMCRCTGFSCSPRSSRCRCWSPRPPTPSSSASSPPGAASPGARARGQAATRCGLDIFRYLPYLHYLRDQVRRRAERARDRRRSRLLLAVLAGVVGCWLPLNLINIAEDFSYNVHCWRWYFVLSIT